MQAWQIASFGQLLSVDREPDSSPLGPHQVRLGVRAVSLNYRDLLMLRGLYNPKQPLPLVPCSDAACEVLEIGSLVRRCQVGQRVCPIFAQGWLAGEPSRARLSQTLGGPLAGTLQQELRLSEEGLVVLPDYLSWAEAASLPCAAVTAWKALAGLTPGSRLLVQGTGGVALFALQLAKAMGMQVALLSSSSDKMERAQALGADFTLNYREIPQWSEPIRHWSGPGVDRVIELGGASLDQSLRCLRPGGQVSLIGILGGQQASLNVLPILMQQLRIQGVMVGHRDDFEAMLRLLEQKELAPVLDPPWSLAQAPQAFERLASGQHFGKVVMAGSW